MHNDLPSLDAYMAAQAEAAVAQRGEPLAEGADIASAEVVIEALKTVYDPEIPVNIYDLGLIYRCDIDAAGNADIDMTLTTPGCPVAEQMPGWVADAVANLAGIGKVKVQIVWEPMWTKDLMTEDAKLTLGLF